MTDERLLLRWIESRGVVFGRRSYNLSFYLFLFFVLVSFTSYSPILCSQCSYLSSIAIIKQLQHKSLKTVDVINKAD